MSCWGCLGKARGDSGSGHSRTTAGPSTEPEPQQPPPAHPHQALWARGSPQSRAAFLGSKVRLWPSPTLGQYPGPASHPTWSIPCPKAAPDAAPLIAMATPILAGLPWLPGPQPQPHPRRQEDPVIWVLGGCHHGRCHTGPGNGGRRADGWLASPHHTGSGSGTTWDLGRLVGTGSPRSITDAITLQSSLVLSKPALLPA